MADAIAWAFGGDRATVLSVSTVSAILGGSGRESSGVWLLLGLYMAPPVRGIFDRLLKIARTTGAGSVRAKVEAFASLLGSSIRVCNYLCRISLGRMRLGVGDPTVLDAFSFARVGDKSLRKGLERAYNETSSDRWEDAVERIRGGECLGVRVGTLCVLRSPSGCRARRRSLRSSGRQRSRGSTTVSMPGAQGR